MVDHSSGQADRELGLNRPGALDAARSATRRAQVAAKNSQAAEAVRDAERSAQHGLSGARPSAAGAACSSNRPLHSAAAH